ncbi:carbamoyltransferase HypF [Luteococcus sp. OSA5]|uniref:carbamoyltransferase HypF n=1 Tax=Luteococcus sp. OSA5 TaxID=3401630 RepID=UPI003B429F46
MGEAVCRQRRQWLLRGVVQGVGFRPHVAKVAARHPVTGLVGNDEVQVFVEVQGEPAVLDAFQREVLDTLPTLARVIDEVTTELPLVDEDGFRVVASRHLPGLRSLVPPDVATCDDCLRELRDPDDRRFGHPFITCTNCGPRLSIIRDLPYDRPTTTMAGFEMCEACRAEYTDVGDRRFHAQPISCWDCGPALTLLPEPVEQDERSVIAHARALLQDGKILAVKGIGGFHLMCDARNADAVATLRERKRKSGKPFAVMVRTVEQASRLADLDPEALGLLTSPARPIVIAPMARSYDLCDAVAPRLGDVGVMLPYAPLHHLLLDDGLALVATSGNAAAEPLCHDNDDALARLGHLADAFLLHDRPIHVPVEDSVFLGSLPSRRSRGHAPLPVVLPAPATQGPCVLGVGGEYKNTFTLATDDLAFVSAHIGDMGSWEAQRAYQASVGQLVDIHRRSPQVLVHDLHPDYATTAWAERYADDRPEVALVGVQHHWAHALSLLAEHGVGHGPVVVAALDGTGYGTDQTIWGGEVLALGEDLCDWSRAWHVPQFSLVGGDRAIRHPWRVALGLCHAWGFDAPDIVEGPERRLVESQLASGFGVVQTSSMGRLFDAASSLLGVCQETSYEAQAAMELERLARCGRATDPHPADLAEVLDDLLRRPGELPDRARRFHDGIAWALAGVLERSASELGTDLVGLTGGVAMNRLLVGRLVPELRARGLRVLTHRVVPPNDGGLSLGQAFAGRLLSRSGGAGHPRACPPSGCRQSR